MSDLLQIYETVLQLPFGDRAQLACRLIDSLQPVFDSESPDSESADADWLAELEVRAAAYEAGAAPADDWRVSLERVRQQLRDGNPS